MSGHVAPDDTSMTEALTRVATTSKPDAMVMLGDQASATLDIARERLNCAKTIPEVLTVIAMAEAIAGMQRRLNVSAEAKRDAMKLALDAEIELGRLCLRMPTAPRGAAAAGTVRPKTKSSYLSDLGVTPTRVSGAQRLAKATPGQIARALASAKTITGVKKAIGIHVGSLHVPEAHAKALDFLADEAIQLLERCVAGKTVPHGGTVNEFRNRLARLRVTK